MLHPLSFPRTRVYRPPDPSPERQAQDEAGLVPHFHEDVVREPPLPPDKHEVPSKGEDQHSQLLGLMEGRELGPSTDLCLHKPRGWLQCLAQPRPLLNL